MSGSRNSGTHVCVGAEHVVFIVAVVAGLTIVACKSKDDRAPARGLEPAPARRQAPEANIGLNAIARGAKKGYAADGVFPIGNTALTPSTPCCAQPDHYCAYHFDDWSNPAWQKLDFQPDVASRFQYQYASDGHSVGAIAVGDLDCDGTSVTYQLESYFQDGVPKMRIIEPPPGSD